MMRSGTAIGLILMIGGDTEGQQEKLGAWKLLVKLDFCTSTIGESLIRRPLDNDGKVERRWWGHKQMEEQWVLSIRWSSGSCVSQVIPVVACVCAVQ